MRSNGVDFKFGMHVMWFEEKVLSVCVYLNFMNSFTQPSPGIAPHGSYIGCSK